MVSIQALRLKPCVTNRTCWVACAACFTFLSATNSIRNSVMGEHRTEHFVATSPLMSSGFMPIVGDIPVFGAMPAKPDEAMETNPTCLTFNTSFLPVCLAEREWYQYFCRTLPRFKYLACISLVGRTLMIRLRPCRIWPRIWPRKKHGNTTFMCLRSFDVLVHKQTEPYGTVCQIVQVRGRAVIAPHFRLANWNGRGLLCETDVIIAGD